MKATSCLAFEEELRSRTGEGCEFTRIEKPQVDDVLTTRIYSGGKVFVSKERGVIVHLSDGDRVRITAGKPNFQKVWKLGNKGANATFVVKGGERFVLDTGRKLPLRLCSRSFKFIVVSAAPERRLGHKEAEEAVETDEILGEMLHVSREFPARALSA